MKTEDLLFALNDADEHEIDAAKNGRRVKMTPKRAVALSWDDPSQAGLAITTQAHKTTRKIAKMAQVTARTK